MGQSGSGKIYRAPVRLVRFALFVFFRQIVIVGKEHVPNDGPVLFAGNHPDSLTDPMLLLVAAGRRVRLVTKDALFRSLILRPILLGLGAVPIVRRVDQDGAVADTSSAPASVDNAAAFSLMDATLFAGAAIAIFPEGLSHEDSGRQPHVHRGSPGVRTRVLHFLESGRLR